jgi:class 3 adenylate cyclase
VPASFVASAVFLRIQDFARRPASEQTRLRAQLEVVVAVAAAELAPESRVVLEAADGTVVVVLRDAKGALRLAERALTAAAAGLPICAGINHGTMLLAGRNGGEGMTGDGIAVAAAIAGFAAPARLLASRAFRDALADAEPGAEAALVPAGTINDPGLRAHELFKPDAAAPKRRSRRYAAAGIALAVALVGGGVGARTSLDDRTQFVDAVLAKMPSWRALAQKISF